MKYGWIAVVALGLLMPSIAEAGGRDRGSRWGVSVGFGYSEGGYYRERYPASWSYSRVSYRSYDCYPRYEPVYCPPPPVVYCPPPRVYYPAPVYREVEYRYIEPRPVYIRERYTTYDSPVYERYERYETRTDFSYRSSGYRYGR